MLHAAELEELATQARTRESTGDLPGSLELWRKALSLLPPESIQATRIREHSAALDERLAAAAARTQALPGASQAGSAKATWTKRLGPFGAVLAAAAKFKTVILLGLTKAKFLLLGLTQLKTILSMFAWLGVYWALYGWKFALGFTIGIYIHEMGHVWSLRHYGLRASAPMFIPFMGAFVSLYDSPRDVSEDARIGLAGPIWGTAASIGFLIPATLLSLSGEQAGIWLAIAHTTAILNLFNLIPVWQLDGGRGFRPLDRTERFMLLALMAILFWITHVGVLILLMLGAAFRIFWSKDHTPQGDRGAFFQFAALLVVLAGILSFVR